MADRVYFLFMYGCQSPTSAPLTDETALPLDVFLMTMVKIGWREMCRKSWVLWSIPLVHVLGSCPRFCAVSQWSVYQDSWVLGSIPLVPVSGFRVLSSIPLIRVSGFPGSVVYSTGPCIKILSRVLCSIPLVCVSGFLLEPFFSHNNFIICF